MSKPTQAEIEETLKGVMDIMSEGQSRWPDESYEEGVYNALHWVLGEDANPLEVE